MAQTREQKRIEARQHKRLLQLHRDAVQKLASWSQTIRRLANSLDNRKQVWKFFQKNRREALSLGVEEEFRLVCWEAVGQLADPSMTRVTQKYSKGERPPYED